MHFPKSKIHKQLGHGPDAGDPKMAKVELRGRPEIASRTAAPNCFQTLPFYQSARFIKVFGSLGAASWPGLRVKNGIWEQPLRSPIGLQQLRSQFFRWKRQGLFIAGLLESLEPFYAPPTVY